MLTAITTYIAKYQQSNSANPSQTKSSRVTALDCGGNYKSCRLPHAPMPHTHIQSSNKAKCCKPKAAMFSALCCWCFLFIFCLVFFFPTSLLGVVPGVTRIFIYKQQIYLWYQNFRTRYANICTSITCRTREQACHTLGHNANRIY